MIGGGGAAAAVSLSIVPVATHDPLVRHDLIDLESSRYHKQQEVSIGWVDLADGCNGRQLFSQVVPLG